MARKRKTAEGQDLLAANRAAAHEFHLVRSIEAGIVLTGPEVKSARLGQVNLRDSYARIRNGEIFLHNAHFNPYTHSHLDDCDPRRPRKLLLHSREIRKLAKDVDSSGMTLVPTRMYLKKGRIKIEIAVARGKKTYDKRESSRRKEVEREMARARSVR